MRRPYIKQNYLSDNLLPHGMVPVAVFLNFATHYILEQVTQLGGDGPHLAFADRPVVDFSDSGDLRGCAGHEELFAHVDFSTVNLTLHDFQTKFFAGKFNG